MGGFCSMTTTVGGRPSSFPAPMPPFLGGGSSSSIPLPFPAAVSAHTPEIVKQQTIFKANLDSLKQLQDAMKAPVGRAPEIERSEKKFQPKVYARKTAVKVAERGLRETLGPVLGRGAGLALRSVAHPESSAPPLETSSPLRDRAFSALSKMGVSMAIARFFPSSWAAYTARLGVDMVGDAAEDLLPFFVEQWNRDRIERSEHPAFNLLFPLDADIQLLFVLLLQQPRDAVQRIENKLAEVLRQGGDYAHITDESISDAAQGVYDWILEAVPKLNI